MQRHALGIQLTVERYTSCWAKFDVTHSCIGDALGSIVGRRDPKGPTKSKTKSNTSPKLELFLVVDSFKVTGTHIYYFLSRPQLSVT